MRSLLLCLSVLLVAPRGVVTLRLHHGDEPAAECAHDRAGALQNYKDGAGSVWFFHITHHAGTTLKLLAQANGLTHPDIPFEFRFSIPPSESDRKAFYIPRAESMLPPAPGLDTSSSNGRTYKEAFNTTSLDVILPCRSASWVSIIAMRDPIERILAGDGSWVTTKTGENADRCNTDNYGLRMLIGKDFGVPLDATDVAIAKRRLEMFDLVLDQANYGGSLLMLCAELGWRNCAVEQKEHAKPADVIPEELLAKWRHRNRFELEVYEYAKQISRRMVDAAAPGIAALQAEQAQNKNSRSTKTILAAESESESDHRWVCPWDSVVFD